MWLYANLYLLPLVLFISITEKKVLYSPHQRFTQNDEISSCFLQAEQSQLFQPFLVVTNALVPSLSSWLCAGLAIVSPCPSCSWEPMNVHSIPDVPYQPWAEGRDHLVDLLAMLCLKQGFFLDEEYWKGAGLVNFPLNTFKVRKKWKGAKWILFWASRFSQGICSLKYFRRYLDPMYNMVCRFMK